MISRIGTLFINKSVCVVMCIILVENNSCNTSIDYILKPVVAAKIPKTIFPKDR